MAQDNSAALLIALIAVLAVAGVVLSASTFVTHNSIGGMMGRGGMMDGGGATTTEATGPGPFEWALLIVSAAFFVSAVFLLFRGRASRGRVSKLPPPSSGAPTAAPFPALERGGLPATPAVEKPLPEPTLLKLLDEDEKRMYLEVRDHGGTMLQKDIVGLGIFSKAKVTRVLDKLEAKGVAVREAHGMTNRVRIVDHSSRKAAPDRVVSDS